MLVHLLLLWCHHGFESWLCKVAIYIFVPHSTFVQQITHKKMQKFVPCSHRISFHIFSHQVPKLAINTILNSLLLSLVPTGSPRLVPPAGLTSRHFLTTNMLLLRCLQGTSLIPSKPHSHTTAPLQHGLPKHSTKSCRSSTRAHKVSGSLALTLLKTPANLHLLCSTLTQGPDPTKYSSGMNSQGTGDPPEIQQTRAEV